MGAMLMAVEFEILRGLEANGRIAIDMPRAPVRVATLLDEAAFMDGHFLIHNRTVFLEDRVFRLHASGWEVSVLHAHSDESGCGGGVRRGACQCASAFRSDDGQTGGAVSEQESQCVAVSANTAAGDGEE